MKNSKIMNKYQLPRAEAGLKLMKPLPQAKAVVITITKHTSYKYDE